MHSSIQIPELNVFVGNGYYNYFCTCIHKFLKYKVHYAFFSAYSIEPQINKSVPPNQAIIDYDYGELDVEEPIHEWYYPANGQPNKTAPAPNKAVTWADETNPPANDSLGKEVYFEPVW